MTTCEEFEILASAFVDDELDRDETVQLLDHLATCEPCRFFYRQARSLDEKLADAPAAVLSDDTWRRIESRAKRRPVTLAWGLRAAAGILFGVMVWEVSQLRLPPIEAEPGPIQVGLEESKGVMNDGRFIELTSEILRADRRYHVAMLEVMTEVNDATGVTRASEDSNSNENEQGEIGGELNQREVRS